MTRVALTILGVLILSTMAVAEASVQHPHKATMGPLSPALAPFSAAMNFMSRAGYARYLSHLQTGGWKGAF